MDILGSSSASAADAVAAQQHKMAVASNYGSGSLHAAFDASAAAAKRKLKQRRKRKQVKRACSNCRKAHSGTTTPLLFPTPRPQNTHQPHRKNRDRRRSFLSTIIGLCGVTKMCFWPMPGSKKKKKTPVTMCSSVTTT